MKRIVLALILALLIPAGSAEAVNEEKPEEDAAMNIQIETVTTDTFSMDYFRFGHGANTLVILPGLSVQSVMGFAESVANEYQILTDDYTVYVIDRRRELPAAYTIREMAQDTAEAIRVLGLSKINLFGASQGGMIAMEIAMNNPDLIQKLVLGSTSSYVDETQYETIEKWIRLAKSGEKTELYLAFGETIYPKTVFDLSRELLIDVSKSVTNEDLSRFIVLAEGIQGFDVRNDLGKITCPVLVIGSMDDRVLGTEAAFQIAEHLNVQSGPVLYMYNRYGHAAYDVAPDYRERLLQFFSS